MSVVVVSGGGRRIGRATAEAFARDRAAVVLVGRRADVLARAEKEIREDTGNASVWHLPADLTDPASVARVRQAVIKRHDTVDVLVNNAGGNVLVGAPPQSANLTTTADQWLGNFRANVLTAVLLTEALRDTLTAPGGRIVLVSSIAAYRGSGSGSYGAAKAALHPYTYDLAAALGPRGITVNVVAPGYVTDTEFFGPDGTSRHDLLVQQTATGRANTPNDVAETIRWLASPAAGQVTAQIVQVNGGAERGR